jgi:Amidohydrolase family
MATKFLMANLWVFIATAVRCFVPTKFRRSVSTCTWSAPYFMNALGRLGQVALVFLVMSCSVSAQDLVVRNVTVVDVTNGTLKPGMDVLISGVTIKSVSATSGAGRTRVVDGAGKFLIPGLWDMHAHVWEKESLFYLYIGSGVTGVRDLGSSIKPLRQWEAEVKAGKTVGPRIVTAGAPLNAPGLTPFPKLPEEFVGTAAEGRAAVDKLHESGADFIKPLYVRRDAYLAAVKRAKELHMPVAGHLPPDISLREAIDAGQVTIEHMPISLSCSSLEAEVLKARVDAEKSGKQRTGPSRQQLIDTFSESHCRENLEYMRKNNVRITPTLAYGMVRNDIQCGVAMKYPALKYVPDDLLKTWEPKRPPVPCTSEQLEQQRKDFEYTGKLIKLLQNVGVGILAGTDSGDPYVIPGFALHQELQQLVRAGLTPAEALRSATLEPATFFGKERVLGSVDPGKDADLVLLNANPLADISNTLRIEAVFVKGNLIDRKQLDRMLSAKK